MENKESTIYHLPPKPKIWKYFDFNKLLNSVVTIK